MKRFEYIKFYWEYICDDTPVVIFYEVDTQNERYATRITEIFADRKAVPVIEDGFEFITEEPVPTVEEINKEDEFYAEIISKENFEKAYNTSLYTGNIDFPEKN